MKRKITPVIAIIVIFASVTLVSAQVSKRDTLKTFTFGSPSQAKFLFPPLSEKYEKILMHYKLRCPSGGVCGEWDYLMYIWLFEHTGKLDTAHKEILNRFEIGRYITPYGNGLSLGSGFTWTYDVSDYRSLLHDSVDLSAYNQQEQVDLTFEFIHGTPPRDPISVQNLWNGNFGYSPPTEESLLKALRVKIPENGLNTRIKMRPTGHGFGDQENCAEFCPKDHWLLVNGTEIYRRKVLGMIAD